MENQPDWVQPDNFTTAKVDRNDLQGIHQQPSAVLLVITELKCSLSNVYWLAGTARSTIWDFLRIVEVQINESIYNSPMEWLSDPKLPMRVIKMKCRRQMGGLLPFVHLQL